MINGRALVVGVGGLGAPIALLLARAGVRELGLADPDSVELSNLNRQILFRDRDVGRLKVEVAAEVLGRQFAACRIESYPMRVEAAPAAELFAAFDFVVDATDGARSKYVINDAAVAARKPLSHAGILALQGQTMTILPGRTACLRCIFPAQPNDDDIPSCQQAGILGAVAGSIAAVQAAEAVRYLSRQAPHLTNRLLTFDLSRWRWRSVTLGRSLSCPVCSSATA